MTPTDNIAAHRITAMQDEADSLTRKVRAHVFFAAQAQHALSETRCSSSASAVASCAPHKQLQQADMSFAETTNAQALKSLCENAQARN